jgi:hypothetical protein
LLGVSPVKILLVVFCPHLCITALLAECAIKWRKHNLAAIMSPLTTSLAAWSTTAGREEVMDRFPRDVVFLLDRSSAKTSKWSTATSLVLVLHQARHRLHV